ncbi:MAG: hypothetical protein U0869_05370 [Chloroflexota bacterium]
MSGPERRVRDRRVLLLLAACVLVVLGANVLSGLVPGMDTFLSKVPVLVIVLVAGTAGVLLWSVGRGRRA